MAFHIDGAEWPHGAQVFAGAAANALFGIDRHQSMMIAFTGGHYLDGTDGTVAGAITAVAAIVCEAVFLNPYGMANLDGGLFHRRNAFNGSCRAYFRTTRAFGTAVAALVRHFGLHQRSEFVGWSQHLVGTFGNTQLARSAAVVKIVVATGTGRTRRQLTVRDFLLLNDSQATVHFLGMCFQYGASGK